MISPKNILIDAILERGWVTGHTLSLELGLNERHLRALAEDSEGWVISGNKGYKHTTEATPEEIRACVERLRAQARRMEQRAEAIGDVYCVLMIDPIPDHPENAQGYKPASDVYPGTLGDLIDTRPAPEALIG